MLGIVHPFGGELYEQDGNGNIRVSKDGREGFFRPDGSHISGEIYMADPQLCNWVAGPVVANHRVDPTPDRD